MKLTLIGGGGSRTPVLYRGLMDRAAALGGVQLVLHDIDAVALRRVGGVLDGLDGEVGGGVARTATTNLDEALEGADFVLAAIRVGGFEGRALDETTALAHGLLGQETVGPGGFALALRNIPALGAVAATMRRRCPRAWLVNLSNPAGMVTQALGPELDGRVVGVCDSPIAIARGIAEAMVVDLEALHIAYAGLNHLGWVTAAWHDGTDLLPDLLAGPELKGVEEARLFGVDAVRATGALPNEYVWFYERTAEALANLTAGQPRGVFLRDQQRALEARIDAAGTPAAALAAYRSGLQTRNTTYLSVEAGLDRPPSDDVFAASGGYHEMALSVVEALATDRPAVLIVNTHNRGALDFLADDDVVEVPAVVRGAGVFPLAAAVPPAKRDLVAAVKRYERATLDAIASGSRAAAAAALALHPLVASPELAVRVVTAYADTQPVIARTLSQP